MSWGGRLEVTMESPDAVRMGGRSSTEKRPRDSRGKQVRARGGHRQHKPVRKDSIIDYSAEGDGALTEANDRLQKLEESVQRIEEMMTRLMRMADSGAVDEGGG